MSGRPGDICIFGVQATSCVREYRWLRTNRHPEGCPIRGEGATVAVVSSDLYPASTAMVIGYRVSRRCAAHPRR
jgi:hypothetical protein